MRYILAIALLSACCFFGIDAKAQLQANFTIDKPAGCSPLNVKFTNTTTGASGAATWQWNFGNGNTSALQNPGATYFTEKDYTVTLTVKDGTATSTKSMTVKVYKKPTVDFKVSPAKGCVPLTATFTANATAGDGTIADYLWDFGDGQTSHGPGLQTTNHDYLLPQTPPVTLNVTNSFGCYTTLTKTNIIEAVKSVTAVFKPSTNSLCNVGESITFSNTSTGSGTLTYKWDFGDGQTSTDISPTHAYQTKGVYVAKLTVTSSDGCSITAVSENINVANFVVDFDVPAKICQSEYVTFTNKGTKPADKTEWYLDNSIYQLYSYDLSTSFYQAGEHTLKLKMYYGSCSVETTKKITVIKRPEVHGFITELQGACGIPVSIKFKDTTAEAVSWSWYSNYTSNVASTQTAIFNYNSGNSDYVSVQVKNAAGCSASTSQYVSYEKPNAYIYIPYGNNYEGCIGLAITFAAGPDSLIKDYKWNFGDGTPTSTEKSPTHTYTKAGSYNVTLEYTTTTGCKGTAYYYSSINVAEDIKFDFISKSGTTICGNTPDTFTVIPASASGWAYMWSFNDTVDYGNYLSYIVKKFNYDTTYTVQLIATKYGCADTVIKVNYIKVLPPFPHISFEANTCDDTRGMVKFAENSNKALSWSWNFGDGSPVKTYNSFIDSITHTYTKTGKYNVVLSTTNGACTVKDSINAYVLLKQKPLLSSTKTDVCTSEQLTVTLSNYETNPYPFYYSTSDFYFARKEYGDLSECRSAFYFTNDYWRNQVTGSFNDLDAGQTSLRFITNSAYFGCADTSNFMPVKIHGPKAGFKVLAHSGCFKDAVYFTDTSHGFFNAGIKTWEWNFGDGYTKTYATGGTVSHLYTSPGTFNVTLKVTDSTGCYNMTSYYEHYFSVSGPKADFTASSYNVPPNTTVNFYNSSNYYNSDYYNSPFVWTFSDGTTSTLYSPTFTYTEEGVYNVKLSIQNTFTRCADTIVKTITVRKVNSAFTYKLSYINSNSCPPVIATFTSISTNAVRLAWSFGDGGVAGDQKIVAHTYNQPGVYRVVHFSYDSNNGVDSTEDFIEVKGPYALLRADTLFGCSSLQVNLSAEVKNASDYTWDFGDGTVVPGTDTISTHTYLTPGIYVPALILKDVGGCSATSALDDKIVVDSLLVLFETSPVTICDAGTVTFIPHLTSLSQQELQAQLGYRWIAEEGALEDTLYTSSPSHYYSTVGFHSISLTATSPYGCKKELNKVVAVTEGVHAKVNAVNKICQGEAVAFTSTATPINTNLQWQWTFGNGNTSTLQNPLSQQFSQAGSQINTLIVKNDGCADTIQYAVMVYAKPVIAFVPAEPFVCLGNNIQLTASGGNGYQWTSTTSINNPNAATINVKPSVTTNYIVKVSGDNNCQSIDSVTLKVIAPQTVIAPSSLFACEGKSVQINVSGTDNYTWIGNTTGLNATNIANPTALSTTSVSYTVVGADSYSCFTDTANINLRISKLPLVNAGADKELIAGNTVSLTPSVSGTTSYTWSPVDFLNCTTCLNVVSKPTKSIAYTLTAFNADGCFASDVVELRLTCKSNLVYIPTAFSPNNDNRNDRFVITGSGIKTIRNIVIASRWGKVMFQRNNVSSSDVNNSWDGTFNGEPMPVGAYVYTISAECEGGDVFQYKGTIMLLR